MRYRQCTKFDDEGKQLSVSMATPSSNGTARISKVNAEEMIKTKDMAGSSPESVKPKSESVKPKSVLFDIENDERRNRHSAIVRQKKLGPLDRKRQTRRRKVSHKFPVIPMEASVKEMPNNGKEQTETKGTEEKTWNWLFFWKKSDDSRRKSELALVNFDKIFRYTNMSRLWGAGNCQQGINQLDENGFSPLHMAAQSDDVELIKELLEKGIDINVKSSVNEATALHIAATYNCVKTIEVLLQHGADVSDALTNGQTALHSCCRRGHLKVIKILIETGKADINSRDRDKTTPLHQALINGEVEMCTYLVENGADICAKDINNETPLMLAAKGGSLDIIHYLLTIASQRGIGMTDYISVTDNEGNTALHLAVTGRHKAVCKNLIDRGAKVNCKKETNGFTALHQAAVLGDASLVDMLIDKGALTEMCDKAQMTPLHRAALYNRVDAILILIRQGLFLDPRDEDHFTPLMCSAWKGQVEAGRSLLRYRADIKVVDKELKTCLHWAVENQHEKFVEMLFEEGNDGELLLEQQDRREQTPLHYAAEVGNVNLIKFLLEHGARPDRKNDEEKSPLHVASESGHYDCVIALYDACPTPLIDDDIDDMTPLLHASQNGHYEIVRYLVRMGADIESRNDEKRSSLALAVQNNHGDVVTFLIENNADVNSIDKDRNSALHLCAHVGHAEPAAILLTSGADVTLSNKYGKFALDVAIEQKQEDVAKAILSSNRWETAMHNYDKNGLSPMKKLIEVLPQAALQVMDQCVTKSHEDNTDPELQVSYDYRFVDPGPDDISYEKHNGRYFALETMVEYRREALLAHELSQNILARKWKKYAAFCNYFDLIVYISFLIINVIYLHRIGELQELMEVTDESGCPVYNITRLHGFENKISQKGSHIYLQDNALIAMQFYTLAFVVFRIFRELPQMFQQPRAYVRNIESWLHWTLYVTAILFVFPPTEVPCESNWAWGALSVFVTWINFIFILQRFDYFGLYVAMFFTTLRSLLKAMVVYLFFIIGYAFAFYLCFRKTHPSFRGEWEAIMTTFVMTLGEINKGDLLDSGESLYPFTIVSNVLLVTFLFLMPMVLINLTIGISVGDIDEILQSSYIKRFGLQVEIIFGFEKKFPLWLQRRVWSAGATYTPNQRTQSSFRKVAGFILGSSKRGKNDNFLQKKVENETAKAATVDDVLQEIARHEAILHSLSTMMGQQGALLQRLAESQGIASGLAITTPLSTSPSHRKGDS